MELQLKHKISNYLQVGTFIIFALGACAGTTNTELQSRPLELEECARTTLNEIRNVHLEQFEMCTTDEAHTESTHNESISSSLRSQTIQLMHDAIYRLCEARHADAIGDAAFEATLGRMKANLLAAQAINDTIKPAEKDRSAILNNEGCAISRTQIE